MSDKNLKTLIVGGGMAGLSCAAHLADMGLDSIIIEKASEPGGHLKDHHTLFPHQHMASDVLGEKLKQVQGSSNIEIITDSQVKGISGAPGAFQVTVTTDEATRTIEAGAVVIATGFDGMDMADMYEYSYTLHKNVITGLEFEKLVNDNETAGEKPGRPSDGAAPKSAVIIMCTGSRDEKHNLFCCEVGCRAGLNHAHYLKETFGDEISVFICYIDIRATGKDNEDFYRKVREMDVHFIKSRPSEILAVDEHYARFNVFDLITHKLLQLESDLIILETALVPHAEQNALNDALQLETDDTGFIALSDYYQPSESKVPGIFLAGTASCPRDLPGTMANAALAAQEVARLLRTD